MAASERHKQTLETLLEALKRWPQAAAVAAYGSTADGSWSEGSDIDLFAIIDAPAPVESIHFFHDGVPVDLSLRNKQRWEAGEWKWVPPEGLTPLWDPANLVLETMAPEPVTSGSESNRYGHKHTLLKMRRWLSSDPDIADLLGAGATYWILFSYFHARRMDFPGIEKSVPYVRRHDPALVEKLVASLRPGAERLRLLEEAAELALAPVGGIWKEDEVIAFGWEGDPAPEEIEEAKRFLGRVIGLPR